MKSVVFVIITPDGFSKIEDGEVYEALKRMKQIMEKVKKEKEEEDFNESWFLRWDSV